MRAPLWARNTSEGQKDGNGTGDSSCLGDLRVGVGGRVTFHHILFCTVGVGHLFQFKKK